MAGLEDATHARRAADFLGVIDSGAMSLVDSVVGTCSHEVRGCTPTRSTNMDDTATAASEQVHGGHLPAEEAFPIDLTTALAATELTP